jgi:hypothetical protein
MILLITVAAVIAAMVAASVMPAYACGSGEESKGIACGKSELKAHFCTIS